MAISAIIMPKWGMSMKEGEFTQWNVAEGESVSAGDNIAGVASDKIEGEVEAPATGTIRRLVAESGQTYPVGTVLGIIADPDTPEEEIEAFLAEQG